MTLPFQTPVLPLSIFSLICCRPLLALNLSTYTLPSNLLCLLSNQSSLQQLNLELSTGVSFPYTFSFPSLKRLAFSNTRISGLCSLIHTAQNLEVLIWKGACQCDAETHGIRWFTASLSTLANLKSLTLLPYCASICEDPLLKGLLPSVLKACCHLKTIRSCVCFLPAFPERPLQLSQLHTLSLLSQRHAPAETDYKTILALIDSRKRDLKGLEWFELVQMTWDEAWLAEIEKKGTEQGLIIQVRGKRGETGESAFEKLPVMEGVGGKDWFYLG